MFRLGWHARAGLATVTCLAMAAPYSCAPSGATPPRARESPTPILVLPATGGGAPVLDMLASAQRSLWMEMYLLTNDDAIETLLSRQRAGCDVRVILESHPYQADGANQIAYDRLAAAGVDVRWASARFNYTHAKFAVIDHQRLVALTLNLTAAGLGGNREYAAVNDAPADVKTAEAVIAADLTGALAFEAAPDSRLVASPEPDGTRAAFEALITGAVRTLAVEMEELSDPTAVQWLAGAAARGVHVDVVIPASGRSAATSAAAVRLAAAGARVRGLAAPAVHAKAMVADERRLYIGSANITAGSLDANRELGVLLDDAAAARMVGSTIADDLARGVPP